MGAQSQMLDYIMLLLVAIAGFAGAPWWFVLMGTAGLTIDAWWVKLRLLRQPPSVPLSSKIITYFVTGILANLGFAALVFLCGRWLRQLLD